MLQLFLDLLCCSYFWLLLIYYVSLKMNLFLVSLFVVCYVALHSRLNLRKWSSVEHSMCQFTTAGYRDHVSQNVIGFLCFLIFVFINPSLICTTFKADSNFFLCIEFLHSEGKINLVAVQLLSNQFWYYISP